MKLVLFDIDGTILWSDGAGRRHMEAALTAVFGETGPSDYRYDGKTDPQIVRDLMTLAGHAQADIDARIDGVMTHYLDGLRGELSDGRGIVHVFPGIPELLERIEQRDDAVLGLLTGNVRQGAATKLRAAGIDPERFAVGAYGSDHHHRPELPAIAQRRARDELGVDVASDCVIVIGDTPADIECARAIGAGAIGVATGRYSVQELETHAPRAVFRDLSDTDAVVSAIFDA